MKNYIFDNNNNQILENYDVEETIDNCYIKISTNYNNNIYKIDTCLDNSDNKPIIEIPNTSNIMLISLHNSGHALSEIIYFINYYTKLKYTNLIAISEYFIENLPLMYQLVKLFIPENNIIILYEKNIYKCNKLKLYRTPNFNYTKTWNNINFNVNNNNLYFENIQYIKNDFASDSIFLFNKVSEIYDKYKHNYTLYDNIMLIKFNNTRCSSPSRVFEMLTPEIVNIINANNIKILSINDFKDIFHYICCFYNAKNIIISYGSVTCTNRFFCNPEANIICLANKYYRNEYEYENENKLYWHVRHSHLMPVKKHTFLLDFENYINLNNINQILDNLI